jgi:hypothetical protein
MSKKWSKSDFRPGRSVSPKLVNDELRAQQSSATTLDRAQLPAGFVNEAQVQQYALHQVWEESQTGTTGEQENEEDPDSKSMSWISATSQTSNGGWRTLRQTTLQGFKGGNLFVEWSANAYVNNLFSYGLSEGLPGTPNYMRLRILVSGVNIAERRGAGYHQTTRIFGAQNFAPGDLVLTLQWRTSDQSQDAAVAEPSGDHIPLAHLWNNRWIAIARYR